MSIFDRLLQYRFFYRIYILLNDLYADNLIYILLQWYYFLAKIKKGYKKTILFYPEKPLHYHVIYQICRFSDFPVSTSSQNADAVVFFKDTTFMTHDKMIKKLAKSYAIINYRCTDISKTRVDEIQRKVFGYSLTINPLTHKGPYVKKGDINSLHNGVILYTPEKPEKGYVYQLLINNEVNGELEEIRLPVIGNVLPFAYLKHHPLKSRFDSVTKRIKIIQTKQFFSSSECNRILQFCHDMGLDCGELDIVRDVKTKKIYILDANNTPAGPPYLLSLWDYKKALQILSSEFQKAFL